MFRLLLLSLLSCLATLVPAQRTRVACVGNSVTYGYLLPNRERDAYPAQLQRLLGDRYEVGNFGHSGATLLSHGHRPYIRTAEFPAALKFRPDIVVIHLGLNDTDPRNWPDHRDEFVTDYRALVDSFRAVNPRARIYLCRMTPIFTGHPRFESSTRDWHTQIQDAIVRTAQSLRLPLIDLYTPLHSRPELFGDALHPDAEGAGIIARTVYGAVTGDYGGLRLPLPYGEGMVLQRRQPVVLHGSADAGETVTVRFHGKTVRTTADGDGRWTATFPAAEAGGPYALEFATKKKKIRFSDVWVGEVWVASGQSNMEFKVSQSVTAREDLRLADSLPLVRFFRLRPKYETSAIQWDSLVLDSVNRLQYFEPMGWQRASAVTAKDFSAVAFHFARHLADSLGVPVGVIQNAVGGSTTESWTERTLLEERLPAIFRNFYRNDFSMAWARERAAYNVGKGDKRRTYRHPYEPSYLYEAGVLPLKGYGVAGVLWYQGESNAHNAELHARLFPWMVASFRNAFGRADLPFLFVQLSSLNRPSWPTFRDSQRRLAETVPNAYMVVSHDVGDSTDVHPRRKRVVGERLAMQALRHVYGRTTLVSEGPALRTMTAEGRALRLTFDNADGIRATQGFEICGEDNVFRPARLRIEGNSILLSSPDVPRPLHVRYGWQPFTRADLTNAQGFPASTFMR